jgi:hypothetical protein
MKRIWPFPASRYYPGNSSGRLEKSHDNSYISRLHSIVLQIPSSHATQTHKPSLICSVIVCGKRTSKLSHYTNLQRILALKTLANFNTEGGYEIRRKF